MNRSARSGDVAHSQPFLSCGRIRELGVDTFERFPLASREQVLLDRDDLGVKLGELLLPAWPKPNPPTLFKS